VTATKTEPARGTNRLGAPSFSPHAGRAHDLYETPPAAVRALLRHEPLAGPLWEPAAGRGAISRLLRAAGHEVLASDLVRYPGADPDILAPINFFLQPGTPRYEVDTIVTNPPFRWADKFVRHGLALGCKTIVLLRLACIEGAARSDLIDRHLSHVWAGRERLPAMHREGWTGRRLKTASTPYGWFVFTPQSHLPDAGFSIRRVSWRE
jgi:hypothetical protein